VHAPEVDGCLELIVGYNADLFWRKEWRALLDQWLSLLDQIAADPTKPIDQFSLMTPSRKHVCRTPARGSMKLGWPDTFADRAPSRKGAGKSSRGSARMRVDVRELDDTSNRLAGFVEQEKINRAGWSRSYAHRDPTLAVAILAALKAGAVFVILRSGVSDARA
jgi:hypothetical protein